MNLTGLRSPRLTRAAATFFAIFIVRFSEFLFFVLRRLWPVLREREQSIDQIDDA